MDQSELSALPVGYISLFINVHPIPVQMTNETAWQSFTWIMLI